MTLDVGEFIRRFLSHLLPKGFHRIRHYGLFSSTNRTETMEAVRKLLDLAPSAAEQTSGTRSGAAARALLPPLRRLDAHHRVLRSRLPATAPASNTCDGNPDRYFMSVDTFHTTALSALVVDRHRCCSAQCVSSIAFEVARSVQTQPQHRSFKPGHPIQHPQSQHPGALTASANRPTPIKSP